MDLALINLRMTPMRIPLDCDLAITQVKDYAIFMADTDGRAASWNEGVLRVLGWPEQEWIGQSADAIFLPEEKQEAARELETAKRAGQANDDRWLLRKDGKRFFANDVTTAIHRNGAHIGFLKVLRDDLTRLAQVFTNLLINAAKYTERGGRISLRGAVEDNWIVVSVSDNGIGLSAEALETVFEMYTQSKQRSDAPIGLGIGLALARSLVQMHGGTISAESAGPGKGAMFTVRLPIREALG